jgi:hypothetical protein
MAAALYLVALLAILFMTLIVSLVAVPALSASDRLLWLLPALEIFIFCIWATRVSWRSPALNTEAMRIVKFIDEYQRQHGVPPDDLHAYEFQDPTLTPYIRYACTAQPNGYELFWNPTGETSYGHYYLPETGHFFEDD